jgi:hypothetical protein
MGQFSVVWKSNPQLWYSAYDKMRYIYIYPPPTLIHLSPRFTGASKPAAQKSFDSCLSYVYTSVSTSASLAKRSPPSCKPLYATDTSHDRQETFIYEYTLHYALLPIKTQNWTLLFGGKIFKHGRHFDYWNQPLIMRMRVFYLDCHEAGLCCYLVTNIENLLHQLQLFYVLLWLFTDYSSYSWSAECLNVKKLRIWL